MSVRNSGEMRMGWGARVSEPRKRQMFDVPGVSGVLRPVVCDFFEDKYWAFS